MIFSVTQASMHAIEEKTERISDTVFCKYRHTTQPTLTLEDTIVKDILDLQHTIQKTRRKNCDVNYKAISELDKIFNLRKVDV